MRIGSLLSFTHIWRMAAICLFAIQSLLLAEELELGMTEDQVWSVLGDARFQLTRGKDTFLTFDNGVRVVMTDGRVSEAEGITLKRPVVIEKAPISRKEELQNKAKSLAKALKPKAKTPESDVKKSKPIVSKEDSSSADATDTASAEVVGPEENSNLLIYIGCGVGVIVLIALLLVRSKKGSESVSEDEDVEDVSAEAPEGSESADPEEGAPEAVEEQDETPVAVFKDPNELPEGKTASDIPDSIQFKPKPKSEPESDEIKAADPVVENAIADFPPPNFKKPEAAPATELEKTLSDTLNSESSEDDSVIEVPSLDELVASAKGEESEAEEPVEETPVEPVAETSVVETLVEPVAEEPVGETPLEPATAVQDANSSQGDEDDFEAALDAYLSTNATESSDKETSDAQTAMTPAPIAEPSMKPEDDVEKPRLSLRASKKETSEVAKVEEAVEETKVSAEEAISAASKKPKLRLSSK